MGSHPLNLALRFILELAALGSLGLWGWKLTDSGWRYLWVIIFPIFLAALWGTFAVPDDPSRSGNAPINIPGLVRLILELSCFGVATLALYPLENKSLSWALGISVILHYAISYDRIQWLLAR